MTHTETREIDLAATREAYLQLRWVKNDGSVKGYDRDGWLCHYELILPLQDGDVRRERGDDLPDIEELCIPIKMPSWRGSDRDPCDDWKGGEYADTPYRDGVHAQWDSELLGNLPIYVITPKGTKIRWMKT